MAVAVVLFHCGVGWSYNVAVSGVTFFFISSTFLLAMRHPFERLEPKAYMRFVGDHAMRLYPLHWLGLAILIAIAMTFRVKPVDWGATALSALLLHSWSPVHDVHYGLNPVAWYMCALLFCYIIYPFMARWIGRWRIGWKALLALVLAVVLAVILLPLNIPQREAVFVNPLSHVLDVTVGLTLFHLYRILKDRLQDVDAGRATLIEAGALLLLAVVIAINVATTWIRPWEDDIIWLIPQGAVLLALALLAGREGALGRLLLWRPLQWLGGISFEMFVLQFVAFHFFNFYIAPLAAHYGWNIYDKLAWFALPLLVVISWVVNRLFTRPLGAYLKRKFASI
jgi:peptidoglycan/LPS O-acetylase OafA/YrhL